VVGIEQDSRACAVIRQNWQQIAQPNQQFRLVRGDVLQRLPELVSTSDCLSFDCIYFDPPYASNLYEPVLAAIVHHQLLAAGGELAVEHATSREDTGAIAAPLGLVLCRQKHYGTTSLSFFIPAQDEK
jgi:16S rRNA (guanine(966)-N(2))-methyltransferase RsmD